MSFEDSPDRSEKPSAETDPDLTKRKPDTVCDQDPRPLIDVRKLSKAFPDARGELIPAVDQISFQVFPGEILGLLGPNGAGKTTTLRMLSTLLQPTGGTAEIAGFDLLSSPEDIRKQIGFVSASTGVYGRLTARETMEFFGQLHGLRGSELQDRVADLIELLRMEPIENQVGLTMSTGQRQKVSIARALIHEPPVLIFDEATAGLDVLAARALVDMVEQLRYRGKCIIFSTHIMREAERLCDQLVILSGGRIRCCGSLIDLTQTMGPLDLEEFFHSQVSDDHPPDF